MMVGTQDQKQVTGNARSLWIKQQYLDTFPSFARFVARRGGDLEQAKEIFQEAIVIYYERVTDQQIESKTGYLFGIGKMLFLKSRNDGSNLTSIEGWDEAEETQNDPSKDRILAFLKVAGERCLQLLQSFYYERLSMQELAGRFGYRSERSATVQKYKCLETVREEVKKRALAYEDFTD
ncbi:MAG: sigma-70 family RNA polymerase sigma factor [Bacteroidota bacterium]